MKRFFSLILLSVWCFSAFSQIKIEMQKNGGVYIVPCEINGLKLNFIFDTGATIVSLSSSVAEFMLKNGYMNYEDFDGEMSLSIADGTTVKAKRVILKRISIGGCMLYDVMAVITPNQDAPLLLGQSAIQKLGKISIKDHYLIIEQMERVEYEGSEKDISFLGLKHYASYDECYDVLCNKYGNESVVEVAINGASALCIYNRVFNGHVFDEISLVFDEGYLCYIELCKYFDISNLQKALKERDEIVSRYRKKYTSIKSFKHLGNGTTAYAIGYINRPNIKDLFKYPISICVNKLTRTIDSDKEATKEELYDVKILYWQESKDKLDEKYSHQGDDF